ncbi:hypothetical protein DEO72_LG7g2664 [Vigna unguiculata]|uniref:Uncharacterized protein n=1 Tax=Vigna unguiculata TaxID=3917 RepID=A0A4D6MN10_VIGUN|nr:hypothetical protein DEO72_LG7g2664 [Vigna unguiculata]
MKGYFLSLKKSSTTIAIWVSHSAGRHRIDMKMMLELTKKKGTCRCLNKIKGYKSEDLVVVLRILKTVYFGGQIQNSELKAHDFNSTQVLALCNRRVDSDNGSVVLSFTKVHLPQFINHK